MSSPSLSSSPTKPPASPTKSNEEGLNPTSDDDEEEISFDISHLCVPITPSDENDQSQNEDNAEIASTKSSIDDGLLNQLSESEMHVQMVMKSRRNENNTLKFRRDLLYSFVLGPAVQTHLHKFFHPSLKDDESLNDIHEKLMSTRVKKHKTRKDFIGDSLFSLWLTLKKSDALKDQDLVAPPSDNTPTRASSRASGTDDLAPIKSLRKFVKDIMKRKLFEDANKTDKKQRRVQASAKNTDFIQDEFARNNPNWHLLIKPSPCPLCAHTTIVPHEPDEVIVRETAMMRGEYTASMIEHAKLPPSKQNKKNKPKLPQFPKQHMMCMCMVNRCRDFHTGRGCLNCEASVKVGLKVAIDYVTGKSSCPMCNCTCSAYFVKSSWSKLKAQNDTDKAEKAKLKHEEDMRKASGKSDFSLS